MTIKVGSMVKKQHPHDGSKYAGKPTGKVLEVHQIISVKHVGGSDWAALFEDGTWEYLWNLTEVNNEK